jgi:tripartite-type tricarboxylate transporter receptor subunit TctC
MGQEDRCQSFLSICGRDHLCAGAISFGYRAGVQAATLLCSHLPTAMPNSTPLHRRTLITALLATPWLARAQANKSIRLIVPFTPGGSTDILARAIAPKLALALGTNVVVDNKPGAGGSLGATEAAKAEPDGNTLLIGHIGTLAVNPSMYPKLAYDPLKSFVPVAYVARLPNVLVVNASSPIRTLKDLVAAAQARPGQLTYSSGGNGSAAHITFESLKLRAKLFMLHIPYRGTAPSVTDVIAGQVDCTFTGAPAVIPHVRSGRLRALAVSSPQRLAALPDVPTVAESGYPGFEADQWYGLVAPAGTPAATVARLNAEVNKALALPDVAQQLAAEGATPVPATPQAFGELIRREIPRWAEVVKAGNVKPD